ncbi:hypothetical protein [Ponticoccus litoralis]|uniref:Transposase n=1 Tax=Ponticoccus litoralis TaxID=422297 RepID=A0AAW9SKI0_9RHOB
MRFAGVVEFDSQLIEHAVPTQNPLPDLLFRQLPVRWIEFRPVRKRCALVQRIVVFLRKLVEGPQESAQSQRLDGVVIHFDGQMDLHPCIGCTTSPREALTEATGSRK